MNFLDHTLNWYRGEVFEALISAGFGIALILLALLFWRMGTTQGAQALLFPLLVLGLILGGSGIYNAYSNRAKAVQLEQNTTEVNAAFIQAEKERVEGFQYLYTFTKFLATFLFTVALVIFFFVSGKIWQAIAIAMIIMGLSGLVIDYFSKERADTYYEIILKQGEQ
ncbi:hypothetical protein KFE98_01350 [bacterium SCSIO 12741]|nr:hypothetical protein KFE98_01350 [bacterium SCSIO 12741]